MPRRRVGRYIFTPKRKNALSRAQRISAMKRRGVRPRGKNIFGYHTTSASNARNILTNGWKPRKNEIDSSNHVWFTTKRNVNYGGPAKLGVKFPYKSVKSRGTAEHIAQGETWYAVHVDDLAGKKIKSL